MKEPSYRGEDNDFSEFELAYQLPSFTLEEAACEREAADIERKVEECFRLLLKVKDRTFRTEVKDLRQLYYADQEVSGSDYCREFGAYVAGLANHPKIVEKETYIHALEYILRQAIDDDVHWQVSGIAIDTDFQESMITPENVRSIELLEAEFYGVTLCSPEFDLKEGKAVATGRIAPAFIFKARSVEDSEYLTLPLAYIDAIYEYSTPLTHDEWRERYMAYCALHPREENALEALFDDKNRRISA